MTFGVGALLVTIASTVLGPAAQQAALALWAVVLGAVLIDFALSFTRIRTVEHDAPAEVFVGEDATIAIAIEPGREGMKGRITWPEGLSGETSFDFSHDRRLSVTALSARAVRRGAWGIGQLHLLWPSRFGLLEFLTRADLGLEIAVVPNIRLVQSGQISTTVMSTLYGVKENRAIGEGSEFHQLQDFVKGMDVKTIDWKRSARKRALVAKELRAERNHHVIIALDNGYLMREEIAGLPKIDHAINAALATAWAAAIGGDLVGYFAYDVQPTAFSAPEPGRAAFARLRSQTAQLDYVSRETNHTLAMAGLNARTPKRSLIIIFTDFIDTTSAELLVENIAVLSKRHLVIFVTLRDPALEKLVGSAPEDMDGVAALVAGGQMLSERRLVLEKLARLGVTIIDAKPGEVTAQLVSTYLDIKAREMI